MIGDQCLIYKINQGMFDLGSFQPHQFFSAITY